MATKSIANYSNVKCVKKDIIAANNVKKMIGMITKTSVNEMGIYGFLD